MVESDSTTLRVSAPGRRLRPTCPTPTRRPGTSEPAEVCGRAEVEGDHGEVGIVLVSGEVGGDLSPRDFFDGGDGVGSHSVVQSGAKLRSEFAVALPDQRLLRCGKALPERDDGKVGGYRGLRLGWSSARTRTHEANDRLTDGCRSFPLAAALLT